MEFVASRIAVAAGLFCLVSQCAGPDPDDPSVALHDRIDKLMKKTLNGEEPLHFWKLFSGPVEYERLDKEPLGDRSNRYGVVYKVKERNKDDAPTLAMKIVPKGHDNSEFSIHKTLYDHTFLGVNDRFIPKVIGEKLPSSQGDMKFYVMEYIGKTPYNLLYSQDPKFRMNTDELILFLARSYLILRQIHSYGYLHDDAHGNNWAYSRSNANVLFLFDFGRSIKLEKENFRDVVKDLYWWYSTAALMSSERADIKKFNETATAALADIKSTLDRICVRYDDQYLTVPRNRFKPTTFEKYVTSTQIKKLDGQVERWLKTDKPNNINSAEALSRWSTAEAAKYAAAVAAGKQLRDKRNSESTPTVVAPLSMEEARKFFEDEKRPVSSSSASPGWRQSLVDKKNEPANEAHDQATA